MEENSTSNAPMTVADLRALIARHRLKRYQLAARAGIAPSKLYAVLNDHIPMTEEDGRQILETIQQMATEQEA